MLDKMVIGTFLILAFTCVFVLLIGLPAMWLWNAVCPMTFGLPTIGFWQAVGLVLLARCFVPITVSK